MILNKLSDAEVDTTIFNIINGYYIKLNGWKDNIKLNGKNIEVANMEQASWIAYYDEIRSEIKSILNYYSVKLKQVRGNVYQEIIKR